MGNRGNLMSLRGAASAVVLAGVVLVVASACAPFGAVNPPVRPVDGLERLVDLSIQRLRTADAVAATKWGSGGPVADPAREMAVLDAASAGATLRGLDPRESTAVFQDQIEAKQDGAGRVTLRLEGPACSGPDRCTRSRAAPPAARPDHQ